MRIFVQAEKFQVSLAPLAPNCDGFIRIYSGICFKVIAHTTGIVILSRRRPASSMRIEENALGHEQARGVAMGSIPQVILQRELIGSRSDRHTPDVVQWREGCG